jgi:hypothetical protein
MMSYLLNAPSFAFAIRASISTISSEGSMLPATISTNIF